MELKRWEIQVLILIAEDPKLPEALEVFAEYENAFSNAAKQIAKYILNLDNGKMTSDENVKITAETFLSIGMARVDS